jgi:hypothetical protein
MKDQPIKGAFSLKLQDLLLTVVAAVFIVLIIVVVRTKPEPFLQAVGTVTQDGGKMHFSETTQTARLPMWVQNYAGDTNGMWGFVRFDTARINVDITHYLTHDLGYSIVRDGNFNDQSYEEDMLPIWVDGHYFDTATSKYLSPGIQPQKFYVVVWLNKELHPGESAQK